MRPEDPREQRLYDDLVGLYSRRPTPGELAAGLAAMAREGGPVEVKDPSALAALLPGIPEDLTAKWVGRFVRQAGSQLLPGRLERMADHSPQGLAMALLEYVQFLDQHAAEYQRDLDPMVAGSGLNHLQLTMLIQAGAFAALESWKPKGGGL
jgi:hypothetical protein